MSNVNAPYLHFIKDQFPRRRSTAPSKVVYVKCCQCRKPISWKEADGALNNKCRDSIGTLTPLELKDKQLPGLGQACTHPGFLVCCRHRVFQIVKFDIYMGHYVDRMFMQKYSYTMLCAKHSSYRKF